MPPDVAHRIEVAPLACPPVGLGVKVAAADAIYDPPEDAIEALAARDEIGASEHVLAERSAARGERVLRRAVLHVDADEICGGE